MRLRLIAVGVALGCSMLMLAGCATSQPEPQEPWGTLEEYQNYGVWRDPYAMGYGYDPFNPFWYSHYPYSYYYYYPYYYPGPYYVAPRPPSGRKPPIQPKGGGRGRRPLGWNRPAPPPIRSSPPRPSRGPSLGGPMRGR